MNSPWQIFEGLQRALEYNESAREVLLERLVAHDNDPAETLKMLNEVIDFITAIMIDIEANRQKPAPNFNTEPPF